MDIRCWNVAIGIMWVALVLTHVLYCVAYPRSGLGKDMYEAIKKGNTEALRSILPLAKPDDVCWT